MTTQTNISTFDWKNRVLECLSSTQYMALATADPENGSWVNPVYFAWDEEFNIYFISLPQSRHMQNLKQDGRASLAIYSTDQDTHGDVLGIQLKGTVEEFHDEEAVTAAYTIYARRIERDTGKPAYWKLEDFLSKATEWTFVKVAPSEMYLLDTANFGEERTLIPLDKIR